MLEDTTVLVIHLKLLATNDTYSFAVVVTTKESVSYNF